MGSPGGRERGGKVGGREGHTPFVLWFLVTGLASQPTCHGFLEHLPFSTKLSALHFVVVGGGGIQNQKLCPSLEHPAFSR